MKPYVFDMETSDPDDSLTLLLLLGHPAVDLKAVTVTPGTREQIGLVRGILRTFGRSDIRVGAFNPDHAKSCVSEWHYNVFGKPKEEEPDDLGWKILEKTLGAETTLVTGAPLKNLGELLREMSNCLFEQEPNLGRAFIQGGFAGEGVVPREQQLEKFKGKVTCPTFNLNGDVEGAKRLLENRAWFSDLRFVSKNVCHGVVYDQDMHDRFRAERLNWCNGHIVCNCECHRPGSQVLHVMACCSPCRHCGQNVSEMYTGFRGRKERSQALMYEAMSYYLSRHPSGKAFHDPLAACCAIAPDIGEWAEVELYRERGEWGSFLLEGSGIKIITGYDHERFVRVLLGGDA